MCTSLTDFLSWVLVLTNLVSECVIDLQAENITSVVIE